MIIDNINTLKEIFESEPMRFMFLIELISSDNIVDKKTCQESIEQLEFIDKNINSMQLTDEVKKQVKEYVENGLNILNNDLIKFNN
jgi:hypothetical protein